MAPPEPTQRRAPAADLVKSRERHKAIGVGRTVLRQTLVLDAHHAFGKIALAHMKEFPDYYQRLERMEREAERDWADKSG